MIAGATRIVFAVGFVMRPVGGWIMGVYADRRGRKAGLTLSVTLMCAGSLIIAVTPGFETIGLAAPALLVLARLMQGLSVGVLVSASMSVLGRVYKPGLRKTRVFSAMAGASPLGFWIGCLQGGALSAHLPWIFGSTAMFLGLCAVASTP